MQTDMYDTIIIGGGVAGLAAGMYAGRFAMKTLIISENIGGTIINAPEVGNYPGFESISGIGLADKLEQHARHYNIEIINQDVKSVKRDNVKKCFVIKTHDNQFNSKTVIFATGTDWRKLNVPGEKEFKGKGVHYCALCDGAFYKNNTVAVIGGCDSAAKDALLLTQYAKKVFIIYRKENIRAEPVITKAVQSHKKIEIIKNTNVLEIKGDKFVNKVVLDRQFNGKKELMVDGLFIDIGHVPLSGLAKELGVKLNKNDEIVIDRDGFTNIAGVYAAGDVADTKFKQAIVGVAEGVKAAFNAYNFAKDKKLADDELE